MLKRAAYERIVEFLDQGALAPGQMVSQRELVEMTGSTLGSIREAIPPLGGGWIAANLAQSED